MSRITGGEGLGSFSPNNRKRTKGKCAEVKTSSKMLILVTDLNFLSNVNVVLRAQIT